MIVSDRKSNYLGVDPYFLTIRMGADIIAYFKAMAKEMGVPYQNLINLYLRDCVQAHRKIEWISR